MIKSLRFFHKWPYREYGTYVHPNNRNHNINANWHFNRTFSSYKNSHSATYFQILNFDELYSFIRYEILMNCVAFLDTFFCSFLFTYSYEMIILQIIQRQHGLRFNIINLIDKSKSEVVLCFQKTDCSSKFGNLPPLWLSLPG